MKSNAQKLADLAETVVLASEDLTKSRIPIAHALLQKGLDDVGQIKGLKKYDRPAFERAMVALGYPENEFEGFMAEDVHAYYSKTANAMYDAWCAARAA